MHRLLKIISILTLIILLIIAFSGSYASLNIDNLAYVLALGIDTSTTNKLKVSFQFSTAAPTSESGSTKKTPTFINTVEASSLSNAINLMNSYLGKELNLSHCKVIVFSEELATKGISDEIYTLINDTQIRPSSNIVISKCDAKYYLEKTKPELENLISKYYENFTESSKFTGFIPDSTIGDFFNNLISKTAEPYAILGGINLKNATSAPPTTAPNSQQDYTIKANHSSITNSENPENSENIGVAVFRNGILAGELNALETISFLSIQNKIDRFLVSVPDPFNPNNTIDIYLTPIGSPNINVDTSTPSPYIKTNLKFSGQIYSMTTDTNYLSPETLTTISESCNKYLETTISNYLYKTSKELKSDINNFGNYARSKFLTTKDLANYNWLANYENAFFDVKVETSVKSGMLITNT